MRALATPRRQPLAAPSRRSRFALDAVNFFLAQLTGIGSPFLTDFLRERHWGYDAIGVAASMSALGVLVMQTPAGILVDRWTRPRKWLAATAIFVGACYAALPLLPARPAILTHAVLFASGIAQAFFAPLLAGLALGLAGHERLGRVIGANQAWNNLGTVTAALVASRLVERSVSPVFFLIGGVSCLAALAAFSIRNEEIDRPRARGGMEHPTRLVDLLRDRRVVVLLGSTALLHVANASALPFAALRVKDLGGSDAQVAALVIVSQATMAPVALLAGDLCNRWGRKPVFAIGFVVEPIHVLGCALARESRSLVAVQALGGASMGVFAVALVAMTADLARGTGRFHALTGASRTALALGAVLGPLSMGFLAKNAGYGWAFGLLLLLSAAGAALFLLRMPETRRI